MTRLITGSLLLATLLLTGCMVLGHNDEFEFVRDASHETGHFVPPSYIAKHQQNVYLPFLWIYNEELPHDLSLQTFDPSYLQTSDPFESIVLESLVIQHTGEKPVELIPTALTLEQRTHKVAKGKERVQEDKADVVFTGAITRRDAFVLYLRGYAIDKQGQRHPFEQRNTYQFKERKWVCFPLTA